MNFDDAEAHHRRLVDELYNLLLEGCAIGSHPAEVLIEQISQAEVDCINARNNAPDV